MRLFVAFDLGAAVAAETAHVIERLRASVAGTAPHARFTWSHVDRLHLTVRFIGDLDEAAFAPIAEALRPPIGIAPFELVVEGTGAFPPRGQPRVLWAGLGQGRERVLALEREVTARLTRVGIAPETRPFNPHVTLARVRVAGELRPAAVMQPLTGHRFGVAAVDAITLFESRLSPQGAEHRARQRTALIAPA